MDRDGTWSVHLGCLSGGGLPNHAGPGLQHPDARSAKMPTPTAPGQALLEPGEGASLEVWLAQPPSHESWGG